MPSLKMKFLKNIKGFFKETKKEFIELWKKEKIIDIKDLIFGTISYGFFINFMLWGITTTVPSLPIVYLTWKFPAYGLLYYFLFKEFPRFWLQLRSRPR